MWPVNGTRVSPHWLGLEPIPVLYEFDGPRIFICQDDASNPYLAYQCDEDEEARRFLVVPSNEGLERRLTRGEINVRDAFWRPRAWFFDLGNDWQPLRAWEVDVENLPPEMLPQPGVMLWPHLTPVINGPAMRACAGETESLFPKGEGEAPAEPGLSEASDSAGAAPSQ
jgi:hypothetical protein